MVEKNYFLRDLPTLSFHVTVPAKEQSIAIKYTCTLLYHNHTQLHTLPQGSWRGCQTPTLQHHGWMPCSHRKIYSKKKILLCCNCLEGDQQSGVLCHLLLLHSIYHLGNQSKPTAYCHYYQSFMQATAFQVKIFQQYRSHWLPYQLELILET